MRAYEQKSDKIDFSFFEAIRVSFNRRDMPFLNSLRKQAIEKKPYLGLKIYHNTPLTKATVLKIEPLLLGGGEVIVSNVSCLESDIKLIEGLKKSGVKVDLEKKHTDNVDIFLDCSAEMLEYQPPRIGYVELTQTGTLRYKKQPFSKSIISVDDSPIKTLETIGTGDGFVRALKCIERNLVKYKVILFGCGKVGRGIHVNLLKEKSDVTLVETDKRIISSLRNLGYKCLDIKDVERIKWELLEANCVVTATGVEGLLSTYFEREDFPEKCLLANMGAVDEYGDKFSEGDVRYGKRPINFSLECPTQLMFLDPVFYAHNISIDYLVNGDEKFKAGYNPFPHSKALKIYRQWQLYHSVNLDCYGYVRHMDGRVTTAPLLKTA